MTFLKAKKILFGQIGKSYPSTDGRFCVFSAEDYRGLSPVDTFEVTDRGLKVTDALTKKGGFFPCDELPAVAQLPSRYPGSL